MIFDTPARWRALSEGVLTKQTTLVEAPMGYGKRRFIAAALADVPPAHVFQVMFVDESAEATYWRLCSVLKRLDPEHGGEIERLGFPGAANTADIVRQIEKLATAQDSWLVLHYFDFIQAKVPAEVLRAFFAIHSAGLRLIITGKSISRKWPHLLNNPYVNHVSGNDLGLSADDIATLFAANGKTISPTEAERIYAKTFGWFSAVSHVFEVQSASSQSLAGIDLQPIVGNALDTKLTPNEVTLLLPFAVAPSLSTADLMQLADDDIDGLVLGQALDRLPLARMSANRKTIHVHPVIQDYFAEKLAGLARRERTDRYRRWADYFVSVDRGVEAFACAYKLNDFAFMLELPLELLEYETIAGVPFADIALNLALACPPEIKAAHPLGLLKIATYLYDSMQYDAYHQLMAETKALIWAGGDTELMGEWHLVNALQHLQDLDALEAAYRQAADCLTRPSRIFTKRRPYLFGLATPWLYLYVTPGQGDAIGERYAGVLALYGRLTNGHGCGADVLYKGEIAALRCRYEEAEILAFEAQAIGLAHEQVTVIYGASLLLGRLALQQGDTARMEQVLTELEQRSQAMSFMQGRAVNATLVEAVRCMLLFLANRMDEVADWVRSGDYPGDKRGIAVQPLSLIFNVQLMEQFEALHTIGDVHAQALSKRAWMSPALQFLQDTVLVLAYAMIERWDISLERLNNMFAVTEQDGLLASFVYLWPIIEAILQLTGVPNQHKAFVDRIRRQYDADIKHYAANLAEAQNGALVQSLTGREIEIAKLVAKGYKYREISELLHISEWTVKNHIRSIYDKLNIDRRSRLLAMFASK